MELLLELLLGALDDLVRIDYKLEEASEEGLELLTDYRVSRVYLLAEHLLTESLVQEGDQELRELFVLDRALAGASNNGD